MSLLNVKKPKQTACCATPEVRQADKIASVRPRYRVSETDDAFQLEIDIPGAKKDALDIVLEDGVLDVKGTRAWKAPDAWRRLSGNDDYGYRLRIAVGDLVEGDKVKANLDNGVLVVTLLKVEERKPRKIEIA